MRRLAFRDVASRDERMTPLPRTPARRWLASAGAVLAAASVGLAAFAAHGSVSGDRGVLQLAAVFALGHGIAVAALTTQAGRGLGVVASAMLLSGAVLFSGSLAAAQLLGTSSGLAPAGGVLMVAGWLLYAIDASRG